MARRRSDLRLPVLAGALGLGAAVAAAVLVARGRRTTATADLTPSPSPEAGGEPPTADASAPSRRDWRCACGQAYVVAGTDRHRVYWLEGAAEDDPVLEQRCPNCGRPLPAEHESALG